MIGRRTFLKAGVGASLAGMVGAGASLGETIVPTPPVGKTLPTAAAVRTPPQLLRHRFGVNYTPSKNWWYCWNDWDAGSIARDLDAIKGLGLDHLRIQLIWPYFQPNPKFVSPVHLKRLGELMSLANERKLDVQVTVFTGGMSGFTFRPPFLVDRAEQDRFYSSERFWKAQEILVRELATLLKPLPNFLGFDLGNEINCTWHAPTKEGDAWMDKMLTLMERECPNLPHANGVDHQPWFYGSTFSPAKLVSRQQIVPLHCYVKFTEALNYGGVFDPACIRLIPAMAALARSYGQDGNKPIWVQEYGMSDEWMDIKKMPAFVEKATVAGIDEGVSWFTWWDSHDIDPKFEFPSLEYKLGLLTGDQKVKDVGRKFSELAKQYSGKAVKIPKRAVGKPPIPGDGKVVWKWMLNWIESNP